MGLVKTFHRKYMKYIVLPQSYNRWFLKACSLRNWWHWNCALNIEISDSVNLCLCLNRLFRIKTVKPSMDFLPVVFRACFWYTAHYGFAIVLKKPEHSGSVDTKCKEWWITSKTGEKQFSILCATARWEVDVEINWACVRKHRTPKSTNLGTTLTAPRGFLLQKLLQPLYLSW